MTDLVGKLVPDELWEIVAPLLPPPPRSPRGGRPRSVPDRNCLAGIVYMTRASIPWELLPARELGCGSYVTCWRRFAEWTKAGCSRRCTWCCWTGWANRASWTGVGCWWTRPAYAPNGGDLVGANPVDRGKPGSKLHLATDARGTPLAVLVSAANVNDCVLFEALVEEVPLVRTPAGRRRCRPERVHADKAYDHHGCRRYLARRGIKARIARRGIESSTRLGRHRWRVERSLAWLGCYRRLAVRWDRCSGRFFAFAELACTLVCFTTLQQQR